MKIQLDTKEKTITIEEQINIKEFITTIKKLLPNWDEYSLKVTTIYNWWNPITITTNTKYNPEYDPWMSGQTIYNLEIE